jgi:uncharacterized membrane protein
MSALGMAASAELAVFIHRIAFLENYFPARLISIQILAGAITPIHNTMSDMQKIALRHRL